MDFIFQVVLWIVFFWCIERYFRAKVAQAEDRQNQLIQDVMNKTHFINPEFHGDVEYWFDAHNNLFIAQGKSMPELIEHCRSRFPQHSFFIKENDEKTYRIAGPDWSPVEVKIPALKN